MLLIRPHPNLASARQVLLLSRYDMSRLDKKVLDLISSYADKFYLNETAIKKSITRKHK